MYLLKLWRAFFALVPLTFVFLAASASAQTVTTTTPSAVASAQEWATISKQDAMDMSQWTDLGWHTYSADQPLTNLSAINHNLCIATSGAGPATEAGSVCFKGTKAAGDGSGSNLWILDTPIPGISADLHSSGTQFPIDATTYTTVVFRMRLNSGGFCPPVGNPSGNPFLQNCTGGFLWWPTSLFAPGQTQSGAFFVNEGWGIYYLNLATLGYAGTPATPWAGIIRALRLNLAGTVGSSIEIDWIRLVPDSTPQTINWSGFSGAVDIYLDNNNIAGDGNLGIIAKQNTTKSVAVNNGATGFSFDPRGLAPGTYFIQVCDTGASPLTGCTYSASSFTVNDIPTLTFSSPSPEGSSDDFATTVLGNAWNMDAVSDIDYYVNSTPGGATVNQGLSPASVNAVTEAGASLGSVPVLLSAGSATVGVAAGDPYLYPLWFAANPSPGRGQTHKIDANKYHILTVEAGLPDKARDINTGSISRIVWQVTGERTNGVTQRENVSQDIIFNSRAGYNVVSTITADMKTLPRESDPGASPSTTGWVTTIESFRFDPHEFPTNTPYFVKRIKLAANERTESTYNIVWNYSDTVSGGTPTLTLSYDDDNIASNGFAGTIATINPTTGSYLWNTAGVTNGTYYIYASFSDGDGGQVSNGSYSRWPIIVGPFINLTATPASLKIIATKSGATLPFKSPPQEVTLAMTGAQVAWTATTSQPWIHIINGSGTGSGRFSVEVQNPGDVIGNTEFLNGTVTISAGGQTTFVSVGLRIKPAGTSDNPFGSFDTPASSATPLEGSFAVTGWALDDIGVQRVSIWRDRAAGETTPVDPSNGKIFIADAFFVGGARPDIESGFSDHPFAYRAGWGYLLLSWGLFNQGNGPFTLYAYAHDVDNHVVLLGSKSIVSSNASATKPFGSIDVPAYGGTMSGVTFNFGWALTPNATPQCTIINGNVSVSFDSGSLTPVNYGDTRPDIFAAFPGFSNGSNSGAAYLVDTTTLSNGTHQIGYFVVDNCGRAEGIGSRFFQVLNGGSVTTPSEAAAAVTPAAIADVRDVASVSTDPVRVERHDLDTHLSYPNLEGTRVVGVEQGQRVEVQLPQIEGATYEGHRVGGVDNALPLGSTLDARTGVFYWEPVAGFLGTFELEFIATKGAMKQMTAVRVVVGPSMRTSIDTPWAGGEVQQPFLVGGWTADLAATDGAGIDTVHVWAFPTGGGEPTFLGVAAIGDSRPDVASVYGKQFEYSSFNLIARGLKPGTYDVVVYPHRVETNSFAGALAVRVTVK